MRPYGSTAAQPVETNGSSIAAPDPDMITMPPSVVEIDVLQADQPGYGTRSRIEVAFNLVNATVGAGIIGLPFAIYHAGLVFGLAVSVFVGLVSQVGLYMLVMAGRRVNIFKYADLVEYLLGRPGFYFLNIILLIQSVGIVISYFILLGDTIPVVLSLYLPQYEFLHNRTLVVCLISVLFVFPLNLPRSIGRLARWSIISVLCIPLIIAIILIRAPAYIPSDYTLPFSWTGPDMFGALGIMAFAFACPHVAFSNYLSQANQSPRGWAQTTVLATGMSWTVSIVFGLIGFLVFGSTVKSNLFLNFAANDVLINVGRFVLGFSMVLTIPMGFYPTRECTLKLLGLGHRPGSTVQHWVITVAVFLTLLYLGVTVRSLGKVYAIVGGFSATTLANIIPAAAYLATHHPSAALAKVLTEDDEEHRALLATSIPSDRRRRPSAWLHMAAYLLIIWGFVVMVLSFVGVLIAPPSSSSSSI
ncbi:transmembrane amino acid transporter protein-domain-containing protein [Dichotomocladium elegans]|nr:transmembrane amino acid transporter protein-domain-containing protein [Dichotomocladium elegans]